MIKYLPILLVSINVNAVEFDIKSFLDKTYVKIGVGYKFNETPLYNDGARFNEPLSAQFELSYQWSDSITIGYRHRSQWLAGNPEYYVDELFGEFKFSLGGLL